LPETRSKKLVARSPTPELLAFELLNPEPLDMEI
jgi:hypothetical protein